MRMGRAMYGNAVGKKKEAHELVLELDEVSLDSVNVAGCVALQMIMWRSCAPML